MNTAKYTKNCQTPSSTTTANSINSIENSNGKTVSSVTANSNSNCNTDLLEMYDCLPSPECPNSPNVTMAGSPRGKKINFFYSKGRSMKHKIFIKRYFISQI